MLFNILLYIMIFYMIFNIFRNSRTVRQNRSVVDLINHVSEPDVFFAKADEIIENTQDPVYVNKAKVLKLWGTAMHEKYDDFKEVLASINPADLITLTKKGKASITNTEDSFFYLFLAIPNILEGKGRHDLRNELAVHTAAASEVLKDQMVVLLSKECDKFYENREDRGLAFYERILEGDYEGVIYSKNLIALYKKVCAAMAAKIYKDENNTEKYEEVLPLAENFAETGVGSRWLNNIGLTIEKKPEETEEAPAEEVSENEPASEETDQKEENGEAE